MPLFSEVDNSEFNNVGGGGGGGGLAVAALAVDNRDCIQWRQWQGCLMAVAAFDSIQRRWQ